MSCCKATKSIELFKYLNFIENIHEIASQLDSFLKKISSVKRLIDKMAALAVEW